MGIALSRNNPLDKATLLYVAKENRQSLKLSCAIVVGVEYRRGSHG